MERGTISKTEKERIQKRGKKNSYFGFISRDKKAVKGAETSARGMEKKKGAL